MQIFKFGGASVNSVERIKKAVEILLQYKNEKTLVVISAMGKTTNELELVVHAFYEGDKEKSLSLFREIKNKHLDIAAELLEKPLPILLDFFTEVEWLLHDKPVKHFDYYYDQVVCVGELLSTAIVSAYLNETGIQNQWLDVRDIFRTDNNFRDAFIDYPQTTLNIDAIVRPAFEQNNLIVTQGFIGATSDNESTTLGREGSDFSAAVFANILDAEKLVIWKDVPGVMNADPKKFPNAVLIPELSYLEVIEMAYYGAQVIHPKTIKPLQNKQVPLYVKSFLDPALPGTVIKKMVMKDLPPMTIFKENQVMIDMRTKDFSFVGEQHVTRLYQLFQLHKLKPNLTQNTAISFLCVMDDHEEKIEQLSLEASEWFEVNVLKGLQLLTIRHYNESYLSRMIENRKILLRQETPEVVQVLMAG